MQPVHRFVGLGDEEHYVHQRYWETYDHEVDPIPVLVEDVALNCDFCHGLGPDMFLFGENVSEQFFGTSKPPRDYGTRWATCRHCDRDLRMGNYKAVLDRIEISPAFQAQSATLTAEQRAHMRAENRRLVVLFNRTVTRRELIPNSRRVVRPIPAREVAKVRDRLVTLWEGEFARKGMMASDESPMHVPGVESDEGREWFGVPLGYVPPHIGARYSDATARSLRDAELYWISKDFTGLAVRAGKKLPTTTITREELPSPHGFAVFATPFLDIPFGEFKADCVAFSWRIVPRGVWTVFYAQPEQVYPRYDEESIRAAFGRLMPISTGGGLPFGASLEEANTEQSRRIWSTVLSTWFLLRQPGVAEETRERPEKRYAASYGRANPGRPLPEVRVVDLRRRPRTAKRSSSTEGRTISVRSLVGGDTGGFWRQQPYGPEQSLRKQIWIDPFIRGPEGAPFKEDVPKVNRLR